MLSLERNAEKEDITYSVTGLNNLERSKMAKILGIYSKSKEVSLKFKQSKKTK